MNDWSLLEVEAVDGSPGYYVATYFGEGTPLLDVEITFYQQPGTRAEIARCEVGTSAIEPTRGKITPGRLRAIPYGQLTAMVEPFIIELETSGGFTVSGPAHDDVLEELYDFQELRKEWPKGDLTKVSTAVADVYLSAIGNGTPPKNDVAERFNTSKATAGRMIAKARELGILKVSSVGGRPKE